MSLEIQIRSMEGQKSGQWVWQGDDGFWKCFWVDWTGFSERRGVARETQKLWSCVNQRVR